MHLYNLFSDFSHNRQWYWQLVYFVHYTNHLISSQSHSSIDTSKLDFSWTNVYNGTYHLVRASSGWWKFSWSFHLWTEEHLTINTEAMDKIRLVLLQAWYKMNVRSGELGDVFFFDFNIFGSYLLKSGSILFCAPFNALICLDPIFIAFKTF